MRLDEHSYTPDLKRRIVTLAGQMKSFAQVAVALATAADVSISDRNVQRLTQEVGTDLARLRDEQAARYRRRELPPRIAQPPAVAVVEVDGGRLGTRQAGAGPGVHQAQPKEDKVACLVSMRSQVHAADPQPEPPASFRDARRVARLVQQMQAQATPLAQTAAVPAGTPAVPAEASSPPAARDERPSKPKPLLRTCLASMKCSREFGPLVAGEAQARAFYAAPRQAFLGDGQKYNWTIQRTWFPHFVAIADFLHVLCYVYRAAWAVGSDETERWRQFETWMTACWQGRVDEVLEELAVRQGCCGRPPPGTDGAVAEVLAEVVCYLRNNRARMDYPRYRREGLPVTSSLVESLVGEFNGRVKGKDKYWDRPGGAEAILQVRAAVLSEDDRLERYFAEQPGNPYRRRYLR